MLPWKIKVNDLYMLWEEATMLVCHPTMTTAVATIYITVEGSVETSQKL